MDMKYLYYFEMLRCIKSYKIFYKALNYLRYRISTPKPLLQLSEFSPQIVHLIATNRCNLKCGYCNSSKYISYDSGDKSEELSLKKIDFLLNTPLLKNVLLVDILGGEPLLIHDIDGIVKFVVSHGHFVNMSTNGLLLSNHITALKKAGISRINLSLYPTNLKLMSRELSSINKVFPVHTSYVLTRSELEKSPDIIFEIVDMAKNSGVKSMRFWMYRPLGLNADLTEIIKSTDPSYVQFFEKADSIYGNFILWPKVISKPEARKKRCRQLWQHVVIDYLGNIAPCCGIDDILPPDEANIFTMNSEAIFNHPKLISMRENILDESLPPLDPCKNCNLLEEPGW